jgi:hypothetical protein
MRPVIKAKRLFPRVLLRKATSASSAGLRRVFPAWIDASDHGLPFSAVTVTPRVRDGLVLRQVAKGKPGGAKGSTHAHPGR